MKKKLEVYQYSCDACNKEVLVPTDDGVVDVYGYHGHVMHVHYSGGDTADWFACSKKCIAKAIINSLERDDRE